MAHLFELIPYLLYIVYSSAFLLLTLGYLSKWHYFFACWLPNVYTKAPISTTCLLAPLGTKLSIYILLRFYFDVFNPEYVFHVLNIQSLMVWLATIAIIVGSIYAIFHTRFRHVLAFIVVAEIGYIIGGIWTGHPDSILIFIIFVRFLNDTFFV